MKDMECFDDDNEYRDDENECEGCGEVDGQCPLCCGHSYACGSEECDFCEYSDECATAGQP